MGYSAVFRRRGILGSLGDATSNWTHPCRGLVANQTITAAGISGMFRSAISNYSTAAAPWLMLGTQGTSNYRFHSCAESKTFTFLENRRRGDCFRPNMLAVNVVGSSNGWIALHNLYREENDLFLYDPTTFRLINLPPVKSTARLRSLILAGNGDGNAFAISDSGIIHCSPGRSREWTPLGSSRGGAYESLVYSGHHRRLFSLTSASDLEAWDVEEPERPRLERAIPFDLGGRRPGLTRAVYLVRAGGELFVAVRFVRTGGGFRVGREQYVVPTVDFEVYRVDLERGEAAEMEGDSLGGMAMFVGSNEGVATRDVRGLRRDAIYFACDERGCYERSDDADVGIFDYAKGRIHTIPIGHPMGLRRALWFMPAI